MFLKNISKAIAILGSCDTPAADDGAESMSLVSTWSSFSTMTHGAVLMAGGGGVVNCVLSTQRLTNLAQMNDEDSFQPEPSQQNYSN